MTTATPSTTVVPRRLPRTGGSVALTFDDGPSETFTPQVLDGYRIGVPHAGRWQVLLNTDERRWSGSGAGTQGELRSEQMTAHGQSDSLNLLLPPLATLILRLAD